MNLKYRLANPDPKKRPVDKYIDDYYKRSGVTEKDIELWENFAKALDARHILWKDYTLTNVMARGHQVVISDLGYNDSPKQKIPVLDI